MVFKAVIFDMGGVVLGSPIVGVGIYEVKHGLPNHYINVAITNTKNGAFQRLEEGKLPLDVFYREFGEELSRVEDNNPAYRRYCAKMKLPVPILPTKLNVNGKELWTIMMAQAQEPDDRVINALIRLRESKKFQLAALTNNFHVPGAPPPSTVRYAGLVNAQTIRASLADTTRAPDAAGAPSDMMKSMFDIYVESAVEGVRKPNPIFYQRALDRLGIKGEEAIFLDDIGINLVAAKKLGIYTIRVNPGRSLEALRELQSVTGVSLLSGEDAKL